MVPRRRFANASRLFNRAAKRRSSRYSSEHPELADLCPADGTHDASSGGRTGRAAMDEMAARSWRGCQRRAATSRTKAHVSGSTPKAGLRSTLPLPARQRRWLFDNAEFRTCRRQLLLEHGAQLSPISAAALGRWDYLEKRSRQELEAKGVLEAAVMGNQIEVPAPLARSGSRSGRAHPGRSRLPSRVWSAGGPLFQAVVLNRIGMARLAAGARRRSECERIGPRARRHTAPTTSRNPEMIALIEQYGGWIDAGSAGYARPDGNRAKDARWGNRSAP